MSLLDSRHPELDLFLQRWRSRLNGRYLTGEALAAWAASAVPAAFVAEWTGRNPWLRTGLWLVLTALGTAAFVLWRRRRGITAAQTGLWLDQAGRTLGLYTAAAECLEQEHRGFAAQRVLAEAEKQYSSVRGLKLPWKPLALRALLAAGSVLCVGALTLAAPAGLGPLSAEPPAAAPKTPREAELPANGSRELTSAEAAKRLFPEDSRLAALAEQALASGDPGALEALLEQNADAVAAQSRAGARPKSDSGSSPQDGQGQGQGQPPEDRPSQGSPGKPSTGKSGSGSGSDQNGKGGDSQGKEGGQSPRGQGTSPGSKPGSDGQGESGKGQPGSGTAPFGSGGAPGKEHSDLAFGPLERRGNSSLRIPLKEPGSAGVFEYILPGADSKLPFAQVLADSRRSAETLFSRTLPPREFENTIRDYFLSLSQEVSP